MKKLIIATLLLLSQTASASNSEAVSRFKAYITVQKVESSSPASLVSKYSIYYKGMKIYNPQKQPLAFNGVVNTITSNKSCEYGTFEYNLHVNKNLWEYFSIKNSIALGMKASGFTRYRVNDMGVTMWKDTKNEFAVNFVTKLTPYTYLNSMCMVE